MVLLGLRSTTTLTLPIVPCLYRGPSFSSSSFLSLHLSSLLVFGFFFTAHLHPSLTQSRFPSDPHRPLIIGPVRVPSSHVFDMIPACSLRHQALQKLKIPSFLVGFPSIAQHLPRSTCFSPTRGKLILIIPSPLAHPSSAL